MTLSEARQAFEGQDRLAAMGVSLELGGHQAATFESADLIVTSPGVPPDLPLLERVRGTGIEVIGELEFAWRWTIGRVIAVTGTKGKSTTTTLIGRMLDANGTRTLVGGNIGTPLSAQVDKSTTETIHVVEVSSFQLETTDSFRPWIAVWLNFSPDHLDRHPTIEAYRSAKSRVFARQTATDWAVLNADDPVVLHEGAQSRAQRVLFSLAGGIANGVTVDGEWVVRRTGTQIERLVPIAAVELTGRHMLANVLAASAAALLAGVRPAAMEDGLRGFHGVPHAMEPAGQIGGVRFVNDSKATNIDAARRSIESFEAGVVAIIGGRFKGGNLRDLRAPLMAHGRGVVAIGESAPLVRDALEGSVPVMTAGSMREAVERAFVAAQPAGVVLLAPACSSFDWFRDYVERGVTFKEEVRRLSTREP